MSAQAEALARLSELLPERVESREEEHFFIVRMGSGWHGVLLDIITGQFDQSSLMRLECALREEIESRGWRWNVGGVLSEKGPFAARLSSKFNSLGPKVYADTPALALSLALIAALTLEAQ